MEKKCASDIEELFGEDGPCGSTHPQNKAKNQKQQGPNDVHGKARLKSVSNQAASKFLQSREDIHLQMMDREDWMNTDCHCIKSTFEAEPDTGCERTLECYLHTEVLIPVENRKAIWHQKMVKIEDRADFQAVTRDDVTSVLVKAILGIAVTQDASTYILHNYIVLEAGSNCLLLAYGHVRNGGYRCLLWGFSRNQVSNETICYKQLESLCTKNMYDLTERDNPCDYYDLYEQSDEKEAQEALVD